MWISHVGGQISPWPARKVTDMCQKFMWLLQERVQHLFGDHALQTRVPRTEVKSADLAQSPKCFGEDAKGLCGHTSKRLDALAQHRLARAQSLFAEAQLTFGRLLVRPKDLSHPRN